MKALLLLFPLAACDGASVTPEAPAGVRVACALDGAQVFGGCAVERASRGGETVLTLSAPDGGFRRLTVAADGGAIAAADGAEPARIAAGPSGEVEVTIASDRFRLPAAQP